MKESSYCSKRASESPSKGLYPSCPNPRFGHEERNRWKTGRSRWYEILDLLTYGSWAFPRAQTEGRGGEVRDKWRQGNGRAWGAHLRGSNSIARKETPSDASAMTHHPAMKMEFPRQRCMSKPSVWTRGENEWVSTEQANVGGEKKFYKTGTDVIDSFEPYLVPSDPSPPSWDLCPSSK